MTRLGIFDSGIGGLTVYQALRRTMPGADIRYFGDTARVPYGTKSAGTVTRFALQIGAYLASRDVDALVVACNTASAYALDALRSALDVPVFGVVEPGARAAVAGTRSGVVGVIGTRGTIDSGAYQRSIAEADPSVRVVALACPLLVPLVEEGWISHEVTWQVCRHYLAPLVDEEVDSVVLGCTHYPILKDVIARVLGPEVALIDSAEEVARDVTLALGSRSAKDASGRGADLFEVTDSAERFAEVGRIFLNRNLPNVRHVTLEE